MKYIVLATALCAFAGGCSYKSETTVQKPASAPATQQTTTYSTDPAVPTTTTTVTTR